MSIVELLTYSAVLNSRESQTALLKIKVADAVKSLIRCCFIKIPFYWNYNFAIGDELYMGEILSF